MPTIYGLVHDYHLYVHYDFHLYVLGLEKMDCGFEVTKRST
jgi:hypothetical protein